MLHLVKKDFFIHKNIILAMLAVMIIYMLIDISPIFLGLLFAFTMSLHIFSSDEKIHTQVLLTSLPVTRKEIVSAKYIAAFLYNAIIIALLIAGSFIIDRNQPDWVLIGFVTITSLLIVAIVYPVCYKFESKYLMITFAIGFALYLLAANLFIEDLNLFLGEMITKAMDFMQGERLLLICLIALVLYIVSWSVSVKIYEKKVF